jgi:hypothetical protein
MRLENAQCLLPADRRPPRSATGPGRSDAQTRRRDLAHPPQQGPYQDLGTDYFTRRDPERAMRRMTKEANRIGLTVRFEPITATA